MLSGVDSREEEVKLINSEVDLTFLVSAHAPPPPPPSPPPPNDLLRNITNLLKEIIIPNCQSPTTTTQGFLGYSLCFCAICAYPVD